MPTTISDSKIEMKTEKSRFSIEDPLIIDKFSADFLSRLQQNDVTPAHEIVIVCIGTDRSTGDSLGPLVGSRLVANRNLSFYVYGTLEKPVHASNLDETMVQIQGRFANPFIIAVDACLGRTENVGCITIGNGALRPGAGVNKNLPPVGNMHITGIVNVGGFMEFMVLQNTRLHLVMRMADIIAAGLVQANSFMTAAGLVEEC